MRVLLRLLFANAMIAFLATAAHAAWHEARSKHFLIYADLEPAELKAYGERLERFDQTVRRLRAMDDPELTDAQRLTIYAVNDEVAVAKLADATGILGFYFSTAGGSYAVVPKRQGWLAQRVQMSASNVFFHEYAHHLQMGSSPVALPAWITEGFAEFFSTAEVLDNGSVQVGRPPSWREWSVQKYSGLTMVEMLSGSLRNMTWRESASLYGRAWLLTHMLTFDQNRRGQLQKYVSAIQSGVDALSAAKSAFGDDLRSVDRDLDQYLRQRTFSTLVVDASAVSPGPVTVRPASPAKVAAMEIQIRTRCCTSLKDAPGLAADARRISATFGKEAIAQVALSEAELLARNVPAAEAAALRAVSLDPGLAAAQVALGRGKMEAGLKAPSATDWKAVRSWFTKANRLDPEHAEPLMYFYRTYLYAGAAPTPNAIDGLLYAVHLAPRDEDLRIDAVRQLVVDNKLGEARRMFATSAYYPHSADEWRARKTVIMDALQKSDRNTALSQLDAEQKKRWADEDE